MCFVSIPFLQYQVLALIAILTRMFLADCLINNFLREQNNEIRGDVSFWHNYCFIWETARRKSLVMVRPQCLCHEIITRLVIVSETTLPFQAWRWARNFGNNLSRPVCEYTITVLVFRYHQEKQHDGFELMSDEYFRRYVNAKNNIYFTIIWDNVKIL